MFFSQHVFGIYIYGFPRVRHLSLGLFRWKSLFRLSFQVLQSCPATDDAERSSLKLANVIAAWVVEQLGATPLGDFGAWGSDRFKRKWIYIYIYCIYSMYIYIHYNIYIYTIIYIYIYNIDNIYICSLG